MGDKNVPEMCHLLITDFTAWNSYNETKIKERKEIKLVTENELGLLCLKSNRLNNHWKCWCHEDDIQWFSLISISFFALSLSLTLSIQWKSNFEKKKKNRFRLTLLKQKTLIHFDLFLILSLSLSFEIGN